jgi:quercetin dioxygenase-like cupin family protein
VQTFKISYPPLATLPPLRVHDGFEWLYVLSGRLRLRLGEQDLILGRGEAAEFDTRVPHAMSAVGSRATEVLSIFNGDGERMHTHVATPAAG